MSQSKVGLLAYILAMGVEPIEMFQMRGTDENRKISVKFCDGTFAHWKSKTTAKNSAEHTKIVGLIFQVIHNYGEESIVPMFEVTDRGNIKTLSFSREEIERAKLIYQGALSQVN
jgi:hypothetical protein